MNIGKNERNTVNLPDVLRMKGLSFMNREMIILIVAAYVAVMTVAGILIMYSDKQRARKKQWRIKESMLFLVCALGGSLGTCLGMYIFRHKTKHWYFVVGMPLILLLHIVIITLVFCKI